MPSLTWLGKEAVELAARRTPTRALEPHAAGTDKWDHPGRGNLLIQGDNLAAMKALLPYYEGAVKLVYMDPPYNTGNTTWIYDDAMDSPETRAWLHREVGPEDLARSDKWLCMMLPRVELAWEMLRADDGVLVVSIDDAEVGHLRLLLDARFGPSNHIATVCWKTKPSSNKANHVAVIHEYVMIYAKNLEALKARERRWRINKPGVDEVLAWAEALRADPSLSDEERSARIRALHTQKQEQIAAALLEADPDMSPSEIQRQVKAEWDALRRYNRFDREGLFRPDNLSWTGGGGPHRYNVEHPVTRQPCAIPEGGWMWKPDTMRERREQGRVLFGADHTTVPQQKIYLRDTDTVVLRSVLDIPGKLGDQDLKAVLPASNFPFPKPVGLLEQIIELTTKPGDVVMDPFVGSGTTAHAVLRLNSQSPDQPERRFVCVEMESKIESTVTAPRLSRVVRGYVDQSGQKVAGLGGSFSRWRLGGPFRRPDGGLGSTSHRALASAVVAHLSGKETYELLDDAGPHVGRAGEVEVFLYSGEYAKPVDGFVLDEIQNSLDEGATAVVYAEQVFVDEDVAAKRGIRVHQLPYDLPLAAV